MRLLPILHFVEVASPGKGERGCRRRLLNLRNIRRVGLHGKKWNHNHCSLSAIKLTIVPYQLLTNALMHLQRKVLTNQRLKLMELSLNDAVTL